MKFFYSHSEPLVELYFKKTVVSHPKIKTLFLPELQYQWACVSCWIFQPGNSNQKKKKKLSE